MRKSVSERARALLSKRKRKAWVDLVLMTAIPIVALVVAFARGEVFWFCVAFVCMISIGSVAASEILRCAGEQSTLEMTSAFRKGPTLAKLPVLTIRLEELDQDLKVPAKEHERLAEPGPITCEFWPLTGYVVRINGRALDW